MATTPGKVRTALSRARRRAHVALEPFQREVWDAASSPDFDVLALSVPRGNGKSFLAGRLLASALTPGSTWWKPGSESVLCAASIVQARFVFSALKAALVDREAYRIQDTDIRLGVRHRITGTRVRVVSSNAKGPRKNNSIEAPVITL